MKTKYPFVSRKRDVVMTTIFIAIFTILWVVYDGEVSVFGIQPVPLAIILVTLFLYQWYLFLAQRKERKEKEERHSRIDESTS